MILLFGLICWCKKIKAGEGSVCHFAHAGHTFPLGTTSLLERSPSCKNLIPKLFPIRPKNYHSMLVPCHDTMPSYMIFRRVFDLQELKDQVSQSFRPSHDAHMFEFHSHFLHQTYKYTQGHTCDFSTNFGASCMLYFPLVIYSLHACLLYVVNVLLKTATLVLSI